MTHNIIIKNLKQHLKQHNISFCTEDTLTNKGYVVKTTSIYYKKESSSKLFKESPILLAKFWISPTKTIIYFGESQEISPNKYTINIHEKTFNKVKDLENFIKNYCLKELNKKAKTKKC